MIAENYDYLTGTSLICTLMLTLAAIGFSDITDWGLVLLFAVGALGVVFSEYPYIVRNVSSNI